MKRGACLGGGGGAEKQSPCWPVPARDALQSQTCPGQGQAPGRSLLLRTCYSILRGELTQGVEKRAVWRLDLVPVLPLIGWRPWASHLTSLAWKREGIGLDLGFSDHLGTFCRGSWGKDERWRGPLPSCVSQSEQTHLHSPKSLQKASHSFNWFHVLEFGKDCDWVPLFRSRLLESERSGTSCKK